MKISEILSLFAFTLFSSVSFAQEMNSKQEIPVKETYFPYGLKGGEKLVILRDIRFVPDSNFTKIIIRNPAFSSMECVLQSGARRNSLIHQLKEGSEVSVINKEEWRRDGSDYERWDIKKWAKMKDEPDFSLAFRTNKGSTAALHCTLPKDAKNWNLQNFNEAFSELMKFEVQETSPKFYDMNHVPEGQGHAHGQQGL